MEVSQTLIESAEAIQIGPGCIRRDLPAFNGSRAWIVEIEPGYSWPQDDHHGPEGELVLVMSGDLVEGDRTFEEGSYLIYGPDSVHKPTSTRGVRLFGMNAA